MLPANSHSLDLAGRPILLAFDGAEPSLSAARVAHQIARTRGAIVHVVNVVDTGFAPVPPILDFVMAVGSEVAGDEIHAGQIDEVRRAISAAVGEPVSWPVRILPDAPAHAVNQEARRLDAALIVMGLRHHSRADRVFRDETTLNVMKHAMCPVLGVVAGVTALPARVLVAMDFNEASLRSARQATVIAADDAKITLAYVDSQSEFMTDEGERLIQKRGVNAMFLECIAGLGASVARFDHVVLHRRIPSAVSDMLLEYAAGSGADLLATGSTRHGRVDRWILGSVSTELARDGRVSLLVTPPAPKETHKLAM